jgi:CheY-like chemotaxis protein
MPEVSGFDVVRELRANPETAGLPVVILTAKVLEPGERQQLEQSVQTVLSKERWDETRFLDVIRSALAASTPRRRSHTEAKGPSSEQAGSPEVLIVDDDAAQRDLLTLYLGDAGFRTISSVSVADALAKLEERRPDLITFDLGMVDRDGQEFLTQIGSDPLHTVPVLVVSDTEQPERVPGFGTHNVLTKPIARHELLQSVRTVLNLSDLPGRKNRERSVV